MKINNILLVTIIFFFTLSAFAQLSADQCKKMLSAYVEKTSAYGIPKGKRTYVMDITINIVLRQNHQNRETRVKMIVGAEQMQYISSDVTAIQDQKDAFTIIHPQKTIIWTNGLKNNDPEKIKNKLKGVEDSLITSSKIKNFKEADYQNKKVILITLEPAFSIQKRYKIEKMEYYFNSKDEKIEQSITYYRSTEAIEKKITTYNEVDFNYKSSFNSPVFNEVFGSNKKLLPKYKGYKLIDNR